jgi:hypothetical protein
MLLPRILKRESWALLSLVWGQGAKKLSEWKTGVQPGVGAKIINGIRAGEAPASKTQSYF